MDKIGFFGIQLLAGDIMENNGEKRSKEEYNEHIEDPDSYTIHDILIPIPGCKVKVGKSVFLSLNLYLSSSFLKMRRKPGLMSCTVKMT